MDNYENKERSLYCHWDTHEHDVLFMNEYDLDQHLYSHFMNLSDSMMNQTDYGENSGMKSLGNPSTALSLSEPQNKEEKTQPVECHWDSCHETFNLDDIMGHLRQNHLEESMRPHHGACLDIDRHSQPSNHAAGDDVAAQQQCEHEHSAHNPNGSSMPSHSHSCAHDHCHLPLKNLPIPELSNLATPQSHDSPLVPYEGAAAESPSSSASQSVADQPYTIQHQRPHQHPHQSHLHQPQSHQHPHQMRNQFNETNYNSHSAMSMPLTNSFGDPAPRRSNASSRLSSVEPSRPPSVSYANTASRQSSEQHSVPNSPVYVSSSPNGFSPSHEIKIDTANLPRLGTPEAANHNTHRCMWATGHGKICGEIFVTSTELNAHIVHQHIDTQDQTTCRWDGCQREHAPFRQKQKLVRHLQTHARAGDHKCRVCKKQMSDDTQLKLHEQCHTEDRPFKCEICHRGFRTHKNLVAHVRTHTGDKPLVCTFPGCGKRFAESSNLAKHRRTHEAPKFECHICKRKFTRRDHLVRHQRSKKHFAPEESSLPRSQPNFSPQFGTSRMSSPMNNNSQFGNSQLGNPQFGTSQSGSFQLVNSQSGTSQSGNSQSGNSQLGNSQSGTSQLGNPHLGNPPLSHPPMPGYPMAPVVNPMMPHPHLPGHGGQFDQTYVNPSFTPALAPAYAPADQQTLSRLPLGNIGSIPRQLAALANQLNANQLSVPANQLNALANQLEAGQRNGPVPPGISHFGGAPPTGPPFSEPVPNTNHLPINSATNAAVGLANGRQLSVPTSQLDATQLSSRTSPVDQTGMKPSDGASYVGYPFVTAS